MLQLPLLDYSLNTKTTEGRTQVFDPIRKAWIMLTPEEHVRQLLILHLTEKLQYPAPLIAIEKGLVLGTKKKRFDLAVYQRDTHQPWLLAECKAPDVPITNAALQQLLEYHNQLQCRYWLITNGHQHFCADAYNFNKIIWLDELPAYDF